jgi:hypothetical protein
LHSRNLLSSLTDSFTLNGISFALLISSEQTTAAAIKAVQPTTPPTMPPMAALDSPEPVALFVVDSNVGLEEEVWILLGDAVGVGIGT